MGVAGTTTAVLFSGPVDRPDMERSKLAAWVGAGACLLTVVTIVVPFVAFSDQSIAAPYYGVGAVSPLAVALLGMVGIVAFAAGANERSDPELVAGLMLVSGVVSVLVALQWALSFDALRPDLAREETYEVLATHRWTVLAGTGLWTGAATWYAAALGLLDVSSR
jgi:hypothetical protein